MRPFAVLVLILATVSAATASGERDSGATVAEVRRTLDSARESLTARTGTPWPGELEVVATDPAGLRAVLADRYRLIVRALHPGRNAASRDHLARVLARAYARTVRVAFDPESGNLLVLPGRMAGLPEGTKARDALRLLSLREAVLALDRAAGAPDPAKLEDDEAARALLMVREGRAELFARVEAGIQGVPSGTGPALVTLLTAEERLARKAGAGFIAALVRRDPQLATRARTRPPVRTSVIFHPERFAGVAQESGTAKRLEGRAARVAPVSELLLRIELTDRIGAAETERALAGLLDAAEGARKGGGRVSLFRFRDEEGAALFLKARAASWGSRAEAKPEGEWTAPDGATMAFALVRSGGDVAEALVPRGGDARAAARALFPPEPD